MDNYDDIINLPHYRSAKRKPMTMEARAAQFAPFAALNGHNEAISETARQVSRQLNPPAARRTSPVRRRSDT